MANHFLRTQQRSRLNKQAGVALVMGLIILLVLTIIGVSAIKVSTQQERMASSYQQQVQAFQGAESAIHLVTAKLNNRVGANLTLSTGININTDIFYLTNSSAAATPAWTSATAIPPADPDGAANAVVQVVYSRVAANGAGFDSLANIYYTGLKPNSWVRGYTLNQGAGLAVFGFEINALGSQPATGARANNIQGVARIVPGGGAS